MVIRTSWVNLVPTPYASGKQRMHALQRKLKKKKMILWKQKQHSPLPSQLGPQVNQVKLNQNFGFSKPPQRQPLRLPHPK